MFIHAKIILSVYARVAKLVDAKDLKSFDYCNHVGSNPISSTCYL